MDTLRQFKPQVRQNDSVVKMEGCAEYFFFATDWRLKRSISVKVCITSHSKPSEEKRNLVDIMSLKAATLSPYSVFFSHSYVHFAQRELVRYKKLRYHQYLNIVEARQQDHKVYRFRWSFGRVVKQRFYDNCKKNRFLEVVATSFWTTILCYIYLQNALVKPNC